MFSSMETVSLSYPEARVMSFLPGQLVEAEPVLREKPALSEKSFNNPREGASSEDVVGGVPLTPSSFILRAASTSTPISAGGASNGGKLTHALDDRTTEPSLLERKYTSEKGEADILEAEMLKAKQLRAAALAKAAAESVAADEEVSSTRYTYNKAFLAWSISLTVSLAVMMTAGACVRVCCWHARVRARIIVCVSVVGLMLCTYTQ
jgi:hypothetical protein